MTALHRPTAFYRVHYNRSGDDSLVVDVPAFLIARSGWDPRTGKVRYAFATYRRFGDDYEIHEVQIPHPIRSIEDALLWIRFRLDRGYAHRDYAVVIEGCA